MLSELVFIHIRCCLSAIPSDLMKSTAVDENLSSMNQQFCSRENQLLQNHAVLSVHLPASPPAVFLQLHMNHLINSISWISSLWHIYTRICMTSLHLMMAYFKRFQNHHPSYPKRVIPVQLPQRTYKCHQVPAHSQNPHWRIYKEVPQLHQTFTYLSSRALDQSLCSPQTLSMSQQRFMYWEGKWYLLINNSTNILSFPCILYHFKCSHQLTNRAICSKRNPQEVFTNSGKPFASKEWYTSANKHGFKHTTSGPYYPQSKGFKEQNVDTIKRTLNTAKASNTHVPQALMMLWQTPTSHNLPSPTEVLYNCPARPHIPGQEDQVPIYLQWVCKAIIHHWQQQKKAHDSRKNAKALPDLHTSQDILYIMIKGQWLPSKISQISPEAIRYVVTYPTGATYLCIWWQFKALDFTSTDNTSPIPRQSPGNTSALHYAPQ